MLKNKKTKLWFYGPLIFLLCAMAYPSAYAATFTVTAQLAGDPREENPDGLIVDVTVDVIGNQANWTVDINSPLHDSFDDEGKYDGIKLDEFYFNLVEPSTNYTIDIESFDPTSWTVKTPADVVGGGSGGATFLFEASDPPPGSDDIYVTNSQNLTFAMYKTTGDFLETDFYDALKSYTVIGDAQLGAHLQSLNLIGATGDVVTTDSGFAIGDYSVTNQPTVPVPGSMALLASGLIGLVITIRKIEN